MTEPITHEYASERLAEYVHGELDAATTAGLEAHLEGCPDCRAEHRTLVALVDAQQPPLNPGERDALRTGVAERVGIPIQKASVIRLPRRFGARVAQVMGAAAFVALVAAVVYLAGVGGTGGNDSAGGDGTTGGAADRNVGASAPKSAEGGSDESGAGGTNQDAATSTLKAAPSPRFVEQPAEDLTDEQLDRLGRHTAAVRSFAAYSAADAGERQTSYLEELASQAEALGDDGSAILECGREVLKQPYAILPTYARFGVREGREVLVLAFAWTPENEGNLDSFMVWAWPVGRCDFPVHVARGTFEAP